MSGPTNTVYVETQALYNCAYSWRESAAGKIKTARNSAAHGEGQGYLFGVLLASLQEPHDNFATSATEVLNTGTKVAEQMGEALEQAARDFEETDTNAAHLMTKAEAGIK